YSLKPKHTYNIDEKGFAIRVLGRSKQVFSRPTICADSTALPLGIIFASKNSTIQSCWVADIYPGKHSAHVASSPSGWTNNKIGLAWLEQVFDRYTKPKARLKYQLLIVDGYGSHQTQKFIKYCH
ncbi:CENP-B protein, partial [Didymella exigua CBS 183.55]